MLVTPLDSIIYLIEIRYACPWLSFLRDGTEWSILCWCAASSNYSLTHSLLWFQI